MHNYYTNDLPVRYEHFSWSLKHSCCRRRYSKQMRESSVRALSKFREVLLREASVLPCGHLTSPNVPSHPSVALSLCGARMYHNLPTHQHHHHGTRGQSLRPCAVAWQAPGALRSHVVVGPRRVVPRLPGVPPVSTFHAPSHLLRMPMSTHGHGHGSQQHGGHAGDRSVPGAWCMVGGTGHAREGGAQHAP